MLTFVVMLLPGAAPLSPECRELGPLLETLVASPAFYQAELGVHVLRLDDGSVLYSHGSDTQLVPASNMKLVSTAAALHFLGPDFRFSTDVLGGVDAGGVVAGDLYVRGNGDPWLVPERVWYLAQRLFYRGVREVKGDLVVDDSYFSGPRLANGSEQDRSSSAYMAPTGAVSIGFNSLLVHVLPGASHGSAARIMVEPASDYAKVRGEVRTTARGRTSVDVDVLPEGDRSVIVVSGRISQKDSGRGYWRRVDNPPVFAGEVLRAQLAQLGITIRGKVRSGLVPADASSLEKLVELTSPRLAEIVSRVNKHSNNFMAEQVAYALGAQLYGAPGNWEKAKRAIDRFLVERLDLPPGSYTLGNASGLHDVNRMTPRQIVRVLEYMYRQPHLGPEYVASLAVASSSGTLTDRMQGSDAVGLLRAKTGTLSIASALSGYVTGKQGEPLAFSIVLNGYRARIEEVWSAQDAIGAALAAVDSSCGAATAMSRLPLPTVEAAAQ